MIGRRSHDDAQSFEDALNGGVPQDQHIADLVRFAEGLCESAALEPAPAFRDALRTRLMTEAATVLVPARPATPAPRQVTPRRSPVRRRLVSLTAAAVTAAGAVGLVASSASAVPGEMLYPVKRTVENVELQLHRDDASRGSFQLARAAERLAEVRQLSADGKSGDLITDALDDFSATAADGSSRLFEEFGATGQESPIRTVNEFAAASSLDLSRLSGQLPEEAAPSLDAASQAVTNLASEASALCGTCAPADVTSLLKAVAGAAEDTPATTTDSTTSAKRSEPASSGPRTTAPAPAPTVASTTPPRDATPATTKPTAPLPTRTPALTDLTDPLLGGLLGDDEQVGLVPGLLNGLLGTPPKTPKAP